MERMRVALVTGSSTGIGFEASLALSRNGIHTFATMRDSHKSEAIMKKAREERLPLEVVEMDVDSEDSVGEAVHRIIDEKKRIDILVNNAGYGLFGALEELPIDEIKKQFETNYFGAVRAIKEVLPSMRKQRSGIIINISSIAGVVGIPGESIYSSSKFALEGLSESISYELKPYGIKMVLIEPGVINSNFVQNIRYPNNAEKKSKQMSLREEKGTNSGGSDINHEIDKSSTSLYYSNTMDAFLSHYYSAMKNAPPPTLVSAVIIEAIMKATMSSQYLFRYTVGEDSKSLAAAKKNMTDFQLHDYISKRLLV
jgi:NAD(P)-dependent dehydrogenase (short-subunit alcohol dehydrogenase family)